MTEQDLIITRVGHQGDGIAETPAGPVFAPLTLPGERVRAEVRQGRAERAAILEPSPERVAPVSPHYGECGGCSLQHWASGPYLAWKREQVRLQLARERIDTEIDPTVASPPASRRRLALHARRKPDGRVALGFKARKSWSLVEISSCPVADPRLVAAFPALARVADAVLDHPKSAPTLHATWTLTGLDVDVTGVERRSGGLSADRRRLAAARAAEADLARLTLAGEMLYLARQPMVRFGVAAVALPAGGFLQAVPEAEAAMVARAVEAVRGARRIADLFCGAGAFTFPLAEAAPVLAAGSSAGAIAAPRGAGGAPRRLWGVRAAARGRCRRPLSPHALKGCEAIVFDPPRAGALEQSRQSAGSGAAVVVGVSCNPATFARDARVLIDAGFRLERVTPVDQFLWSAHIELVGVFRR